MLFFKIGCGFLNLLFSLCLVVRFGQLFSNSVEVIPSNSLQKFSLDLFLLFFLHMLYDPSHFQDFVTSGPLVGVHLEERANYCAELVGIFRWEAGVNAPSDFFIEGLHVFSLEGNFQTYHLIENTAQRPNVRFFIIGLIFPYFWTCVVGSASLGDTQSFLGNLGDVHISQLGFVLVPQENVGGLGRKEVTLISRWRILRSWSCLRPLTV